MTPLGPAYDDAERLAIRSMLSSHHIRREALAIAIFLIDGVVFVALVTGATLLRYPVLRLLSGIAAGFQILRLSSIAHDAGHLNYTNRRLLDKTIARLAFLPALQPFGTWEIAHNVIHHSWTSIRGRDYVWIPKTKQEFDESSPFRQRLERLYRGPWGHGFYYFLDLWFPRVFLASWRWSEIRRRSHRFDIVLTGFFALLWGTGVVLVTSATERSPLSALFWAQILPFLTWCELFGLTLYLQHTHPQARFFLDRSEWEFYSSQSASATNVAFSPAIEWLMHGVFEHSAHHLDTGIPFYELRQAQRELNGLLDGRNVVYRWSWREFRECCRICKLYDYQGHRWLDFDGNPSLP